MVENTSFPRLCNSNETAEATAVQLPAICHPIQAAFESATGWVLEFEESRSSFRRRQSEKLGAHLAMGRIFVDDLSTTLGPDQHAVNRVICDELASSISQLYQQSQQYRHELNLAHTQLAIPNSIAVPVNQIERFNKFLNQILSTTATQFGFESAALFVLDEASGSLTQRITIGKHFLGEQGSCRNLSDCRADLEALSGSVVVLTKRSEVAEWRAPVNSRSAVCIPVSSLSTLLGTLWLASDTKRELNDSDTNILEIVAGRIAAELERMSLLKFASSQSANVDDIESDQELDSCMLDNTELVQPPFEGWRIRTNTHNAIRQERTMVTAACQVNCSEQMQVMVVRCDQIQGRRTMPMVRQAFDVLANLDLDARQMFHAVNGYLGNRMAARDGLELACVAIDPLSGEFDYHSNAPLFVELSEIGRIDCNSTGRRHGFLLRNSSMTVARMVGGQLQELFVLDRDRSGQN